MTKPRIILPPDAHRLIDEFMPGYDASEYHETRVRAPIGRVFDSLRTANLDASFIVRLLLTIRALPNRFSRRHRRENRRINLQTLLESGFVLLGESPPNEIALGLVGRFWIAGGGTCQVSDAAEFRDFEQAGYAKAVWNFSLVEESQGMTRLATETRVRCLDDRSRLRFRLYWSLIGPFSGLIRREVLRTIRRSSEFRVRSSGLNPEL